MLPVLPVRAGRGFPRVIQFALKMGKVCFGIGNERLSVFVDADEIGAELRLFALTGQRQHIAAYDLDAVRRQIAVIEETEKACIGGKYHLAVKLLCVFSDLADGMLRTGGNRELCFGCRRKNSEIYPYRRTVSAFVQPCEAR